MESPSSTVRRRAWINSSRLWDQDPEESPVNFPSSSAVDDDDVFSDGCVTGKIASWLLGCGPESGSETTRQQSFETLLKARNFDDELSLGADASLLSRGAISGDVQNSCRPAPFRLTSTPRQQPCLPSLSLGHSLTSSCRSSTFTSKSSISEVLLLCAEDAEETLYELGFGRDEPQVTVRIPPRFLNFPSLSRGINFRLFLDSQLRRIREEDPSLSLASRFRQVQVLTEMANAFYSLYSHVSRTPLQKLSTPAFSFCSSPVERIERFRSSVRSEPRSPVERLKDTVSKMCLYTGGSPQPSPKKRTSLPDVVDEVLVQRATKKSLDLTRNSADDWPVGDEETAPHAAAAAAVDVSGKQTDVSARTHGVKTSLTSSSSSSAETVREADHRNRVDVMTYDRICPRTDLDLGRNSADDWPVEDVETAHAVVDVSVKKTDVYTRTHNVRPSLTSSSSSSAETMRETDNRSCASDLKSVAMVTQDLGKNSAVDWPVGDVETAHAAVDVSVKRTELHGRNHGVKTSLTSSSLETVGGADHRSHASDLKSVAMVTYDRICPRRNLADDWPVGNVETPHAAVDVSVKQMDIYARTHGVKTSLTSSSSAATVRETDHRSPTSDLGGNSAADWPDGNVAPPHAAVDVSVKQTDVYVRTHAVKPSLTSSSSAETARETDNRSHASDLKSVAMVTYDRICPRIVESVHRAPFCAQHDGLRTSPSTPETGSRDTSRALPVLDITVTSCSLNAPDDPVQTCTDFLNPKSVPGPEQNPKDLQQVNSFELEEVHSAGEEDFGQTETSRIKHQQHKGAVARGDSMQSDSSGYADADADEELGVSLNTHSR